MWHIIDGIISIPIMCAFTYGLIRQFEETISMTKLEIINKRCFVGNIICCASYTLFLLSYIINVIIAVFSETNVLITSQITSILCTISIAVFLVSRYGIVSKS